MAFNPFGRFPGQTPPFVPGAFPGQTPPFLPGSTIQTGGFPMGAPRIPAGGAGGMPQGPAFLQKLAGGFDKFMGLGGNPLLDPQEQQAAQQRQRMAMAAALLQASGPVPKGTSSPLGAVGTAMQAGAQANDQFTADALRTKLMQAQIAQLQQPATPESPFAKLNPGDFTPESLAEFQRTGDFAALRKAQAAEEPTGLNAKMSAVTNALGRDLTETEVLSLAGIQSGDADRIESQQIPPTQLESVRLPDGSTPPIGTTWGEAQRMGAKVFSAADLKRKEGIEGALHTLDRLEQLSLGENGVFVDNGGSVLTNNVLSRLANGIANGLGALVGTEDSVRRSVFDNTSRGVLSTLIRSMGESGALSDGDVKRALALIPTLGAVPATEREAKMQFAELRTIMTRGAQGLQAGTTGTEFDYDPATGQLVPRS